MDLFGITAGYISAVNPLVAVVLQASTGASTTAPDGSRTPTYAAPVTLQGQVQPISTGDIRHLESLNIQGVNRAIYLEGDVSGLVRTTGQGGDLLTLTDGSVYLVKAVLEQWPNWAKCAVVLQQTLQPDNFPGFQPDMVQTDSFQAATSSARRVLGAM